MGVRCTAFPHVPRHHSRITPPSPGSAVPRRPAADVGAAVEILGLSTAIRAKWKGRCDGTIRAAEVDAGASENDFGPDPPPPNGIIRFRRNHPSQQGAAPRGVGVCSGRLRAGECRRSLRERFRTRAGKMIPSVCGSQPFAERTATLPLRQLKPLCGKSRTIPAHAPIARLTSPHPTILIPPALRPSPHFLVAEEARRSVRVARAALGTGPNQLPGMIGFGYSLRVQE